MNILLAILLVALGHSFKGRGIFKLNEAGHAVFGLTVFEAALLLAFPWWAALAMGVGTALGQQITHGAYFFMNRVPATNTRRFFGMPNRTFWQCVAAMFAIHAVRGALICAVLVFLAFGVHLFIAGTLLIALWGVISYSVVGYLPARWQITVAELIYGAGVGAVLAILSF